MCPIKYSFSKLTSKNKIQFAVYCSVQRGAVLAAQRAVSVAPGIAQQLMIQRRCTRINNFHHCNVHVYNSIINLVAQSTQITRDMTACSFIFSTIEQSQQCARILVNAFKSDLVCFNQSFKLPFKSRPLCNVLYVIRYGRSARFHY